MEVAAHDFWTTSPEDVLEVTELLLHSGAQVNVRDRQSNTALILCTRHTHKLALPLIQAGADVKCPQQRGRYALSHAYDDDLKRLLTQHDAVRRDESGGASKIPELRTTRCSRVITGEIFPWLNIECR